MQNRIYWGTKAPKDWKRASPEMSSVPSVPMDIDTKQSASTKVYRFVVSTDTVDLMGDRINQRGWDLKDYRKNPVVLWAHDASTWPVGRAVKIGVEDNKLVASVMFADSHEGRKAASLVDQGMLRATSVGFQPLEHSVATEKGRMGSYNYEKQKLLEFSCCNVPANPDCLLCRSADEERAERAAENTALAANLRIVAAEDKQFLAMARRKEAREAYHAETTPEQRKADREAMLLKIRGQG